MHMAIEIININVVFILASRTCLCIKKLCMENNILLVKQDCCS